MNNKLPDFFDKFTNIPWIKDNTILVVKHGSKAYGTNIEGSDDDYKGICIPTKKHYLGYLNGFEQAELKEPDAVIFGINKFFKLAQEGNPNCLEVLFVDPEDVLYCDEIGQELLDNRDLFLSKKIKFTMAGYAISQLKRIKLHRKYFLNPPKAPPTRAQFNLPEYTLIPKNQLDAANAVIHKEVSKLELFLDDLSEPTKIEIKSAMTDLLSKLKVSSDQKWEFVSKQIGFDDNLIDILRREKEFSSAKISYEQYKNWETNRNPERAAQEKKFGFDGKHALHLVRLFRMCKEALTTGKLLVRRPDREELLAVRRGEWTYEELIEAADQAEIELQEIYKTSNVLPREPDRVKLESLCMKLIERKLSL